MSALEWGVLPEESRAGVIACASRADAVRTAARSGQPGALKVAAVCRLPGKDWHPADREPLLDRIVQLTAERDWALEQLAAWEGVIR